MNLRPPAVTTIRSPANPRVKALVRLQHHPAARRQRGLFCVESERELDRALAEGFVLDALYASADWLRGSGRTGDLADRGGALFEVSERVLRKITYRQRPEGLVAVFRARRRTLGELRPRRAAPLLIVCSGLEKPGNLGAILRTADAAAVDAVLLDRPDADLFNPNCVRASTGAVFALPLFCATPAELMAWLREHRIPTFALHPEGTTPYTGADLTGPAALVVGREAEGLGAEWVEGAETTLRVPMRGRVADSLNVSVAAALVLYEAGRQRGWR